MRRELTDEEWERLIAAAPEMAEALAEWLPIAERLFATLPPGAEDTKAYKTAWGRIERMRAALAKARGEA